MKLWIVLVGKWNTLTRKRKQQILGGSAALMLVSTIFVLMTQDQPKQIEAAPVPKPTVQVYVDEPVVPVARDRGPRTRVIHQNDKQPDERPKPVRIKPPPKPPKPPVPPDTIQQQVEKLIKLIVDTVTALLPDTP